MALTANVLEYMNISEVKNSKSFPVLANAHIFAGSLCISIAGGPGATPGVASATGVFLGVALEERDNTGGATGDLDVPIAWDCMIDIGSANHALIAELGFGAYLDADDNVEATLHTPNSIFCGKIVEILDATHVRVHLAHSAT